MRGLILGAVLVVGGVAVASETDATDVTRKWEKAKSEGKKVAKQAGNRLGLGNEEQGFDIQGVVKKGASDEVTLSREGLPPAELEIRDTTKIYLNGRTVSAKELHEGDAVRAKFQLEGDEPVALRIDIEKSAK